MELLGLSLIQLINKLKLNLNFQNICNSHNKSKLLLNPSIPLLSPPSLLAFTIYSSLHHLFKDMAMHKALVICIATLLFCSVFLIEAANSTPINYGPISKGDPSCNNTSGCTLPPPSNPYNRGCSKIKQCRGGQPPAEGKK